jgi:hypothetical protein
MMPGADPASREEDLLDEQDALEFELDWIFSAAKYSGFSLAL